MAFTFSAGWDTQPANNNGTTVTQIVAICATANTTGSGDAGLRGALTTGSDTIDVVKGIHQDTIRHFPHLTVDYLGGRWHVGRPSARCRAPRKVR